MTFVNRLLLLGALVPQAALAAPPFCVNILGIASQCIYDDPSLCQADASKQGGTCDPNPNSTIMKAGIGTGQYCMVIAGGVAQCAYFDYGSCLTVALKQHGTCFFDASRSYGAANPYSVSNGAPSD